VRVRSSGVASVAGYRGFPSSQAYGPTKAAEINLLESLRIDLMPLAIDVLTVCPGFVRSELTDRNSFPMPWMLEADDAARRIADGIAKRKAEIVFPLQALTGALGAGYLVNEPYALACVWRPGFGPAIAAVEVGGRWRHYEGWLDRSTVIAP
jgi:NAD(P)-dependent dehydrogenase (short-subunit alcohol dehydrogenase family)